MVMDPGLSRFQRQCISFLIKLFTLSKMKSHLENTGAWRPWGIYLLINSPNYAIVSKIVTIRVGQRSLPPAS